MRSVAEALAAQHKEGRLVGRLLGRTWSRLRSAGAKVLALAAAYAAGTLRLRPYRERPYRPRPKAPPEAEGAAPPTPVPTPLLAEPKLPTGFGWLLKRARVAFGRSQMQHLLAQPDMQALIAAVPPIVRHLRPVCRMLGVKPPPGLFAPRRKSRRPPPETPPPEAGAAAPSPRKRRRKPARRAAEVPELYAAPRLLPPRPPFKPLDKRWIPPDRRHLFKSA